MFRCRNINRVLSRVRKRLSGKSVGDLILSTRELVEDGLIETDECLHEQFALWIASYDLWRKSKADSFTSFEFLEIKAMLAYFDGRMINQAWARNKEEWAQDSEVTWINSLLLSDVKILELRGAHGNALLEWATVTVLQVGGTILVSTEGEWCLGMNGEDYDGEARVVYNGFHCDKLQNRG